MNGFWPKLSAILEWSLCAGLVGWVLWRWLKRSDDPARLVSKWTLSAVMIAITWWIAGRKIAGSTGGTDLDYGTAFVVVIACAVCGIVLGLTWGSEIGGLLGRPLTSLFDGGDQELTPAPMYSIAEARRKQGKYREAAAEIRKQLANFPGDFTGMLMLAEVQAEDLNDLEAAQATVERALVECERNPVNLTLALNRLADWQLKLGRDPDSARVTLERVIQLFPDTQQAYLATQRLAHLTTAEMLAEQSERRPIKMGQYTDNIGLIEESAAPRAPAEDPAALAGNLVRHLEQQPLDNEAREKLAFIYAEHYQRLDLATDQLEQLLAQPNLPVKPAVRWLNLLADLQVKYGSDLGAARMALQRIVDSFPQSAAAENAKSRLAHLQLELRSNQTRPGVKLGSYEQNIGLKGPAPRH